MRFPFPLDVSVPLYLAPMAGVSESPFRQLCHEHGADVVVTEFLSAEGIRRENEATIHKLSFGPGERPIGVQIFGADPHAMGEAHATCPTCSSRSSSTSTSAAPSRKNRPQERQAPVLRDSTLVQQVIRPCPAARTSRDCRSGAVDEEIAILFTIALRCQPWRARPACIRARARRLQRQRTLGEIAAVASALEIPVLGKRRPSRPPRTQCACTSRTAARAS